jgi:two-component system, NtrC family, nitrogen regulation response regulator NtrX
MSVTANIATTPSAFIMQEKKLLRILIVDNEEEVLIALENALETEGYATATAVNYEEASRLLSQEAFNILVLDDFLSDKDSLEVLAEWRSTRTVPPLVVVTYHQNPSKTDRARFSLLGAGGFVNKREPFELVETVRRLTSC